MTNIKLILILNLLIALSYFYIDQYFHTHFTSDYSYTRPDFEAFYLFDTWGYAILLSSFLMVLAALERDRFRAYSALILIGTSAFNVAFIGVNSGFYFPWNLATTEPGHWLMQWGFNLIVGTQWMLFLIGVLKERRFTLILVPLGISLIGVTSLLRYWLLQVFNIVAAPIEVAYGVTVLVLSVFTTFYLFNRSGSSIASILISTVTLNVSFFAMGMIAYYAPSIHDVVPLFILERDWGVVSILMALMASLFSVKAMRVRVFSIDKRFVLAFTVIAIFSTPFLGYAQYQGRIPIYSTTNSGSFIYSRDGKNYTGFYDARYQPAMDWIKSNTRNDSVFLCWWDYGHMIRGIALRESVVYNPSVEILWAVSDPSSIKDYSSHKEITDTAGALLTENSSTTLSMMRTYDSIYFLVSKEDQLKAWVLAKILNMNSETYVKNGVFTYEGDKTILSKAIRGLDVEGFKLVYRDEIVSIYQLK